MPQVEPARFDANGSCPLFGTRELDLAVPRRVGIWNVFVYCNDVVLLADGVKNRTDVRILVAA